MTRTEINEKLNKVFAEVFDDESLVVTDETTANDIDDWDSLAQMTLIPAIEEMFSIELNLNEINNFKNVGEMITCIQKHLG